MIGGPQTVELSSGNPAPDPPPSASPPCISVVGVAGAEAPRGLAERLEHAELVVGSADRLAAHVQAATASAELGGDLGPALERIAAANGPVVVLASGDPGFFGIVRLLAERFGRERLDVLPAPSAVSLAFARAGLAWDDALVVSAHGRAPAAAVNAARAHGKVAVLTAPDFTPGDLARELVGLERVLLVAERLGEPDERVTEGSPAEIRECSFTEPNVVLCIDPARAVGPKGRAWPPRSPAGWALPEEAFEHRGGMITKSEVRALVLARLGPGTGDLIWDIGTGSGSVAVECARFGAAVIALDRDAEQCGRARANAARHEVCVEVLHGTAPEALAALPDPDCVFVGGAGAHLEPVVELAASRARRRVVVALAALERVAPAAASLRACGFDVESVMLAASRLEDLAGLTRLDALNPVFVVSGSRTAGASPREPAEARRYAAPREAST